MEIEIVNEAKQREEREKRLQPLMEPEAFTGPTDIFLPETASLVSGDGGNPFFPVEGISVAGRGGENESWRRAGAGHLCVLDSP